MVTGVTVEHIPKELTPNGSLSSAPKQFRIWVSACACVIVHLHLYDGCAGVQRHRHGVHIPRITVRTYKLHSEVL